MTIFRRKLTFLTVIGLMTVAAAGAVLAFDWQIEERKQEMLAFLQGAVPVKKGDDLASLEGRLVYASGRPVSARPLSDPDLGLVFNALSIRRESEIYQWAERGGKDPKYRAAWSDAPIDSRYFRRPAGHENKGRLEFASYGDAAENVTVGGVAIDPSFVAGQKSRIVPVTEEMFAKLPEAVRARYSLDNGRLVEGGAVSRNKSDPERIGANRISFQAAIPQEGIVVGFMHDGRIVPGETDLLGHVGAYVPGASDMTATIREVDDSDEQAHMFRLLSILAMAGLAGGALFRDFSTAEIIEKPLKFGR